MQPFIKSNGIVRFQSNKIVEYLLDEGQIDLNHLAAIDFPQKDWEQFYQLIGYSLCGFHELSNVSDETALAATQAARSQGFADAKGCRDDGCEIHCGVETEWTDY